MAGTSRRPHFATPQRRDVSASFVFSSLKAKRGAELEASGIVRARARKSEQSDIDLYEEPVICIFPCFLGQ